MRKMNMLVLWLSVLACLTACATGQPDTPESQLPAQTETTIFTQPTEQVTVEPTIPETEPPAVVETVAEQISDGVQVLVNGNDYSNKLCDDNHYTKKQINQNQMLRVVSDASFAAVYIEWDRVPGPYTIAWQGGSIECGKNEFLHEFIRLPEEVNEVEFAFTSDADQLICEIELYTSGSAPEGVQDWLPPCDQADVLVFPTHSDDDVLFFGPLISYYAIEQRLTVQTAFMVNHSGKWERPHERLNGLWEMGVRNYPILGDAPDTGKYDMAWGMNFYAKSDIPGWQIEQIRRFKPLVVLGHDLDGEYGNAGHKVNAYYLTQSIVAAADPEQYPESAAQYGVWDTPKLYLHLYAENEWYFDVNTPMANDPEGRTPYEVAEDALKYHVSQIRDGLHMYQSDEARSWDCRPFGLYRSLVGADSTADIMENINPQDWR